MSKLLRVLGLAVFITAVWAQAASAWEGMRWLPNTCGADLVTPFSENGALWIKVVNTTTGEVLFEGTVPAEQYPATSPLTVGGFSGRAFARVSYEVANAANHADGYVRYVQRQVNCIGPAGAQGPPGPAGPAGPQGPPGTTTVISTATNRTLEPKRCTSRRVYKFVVRRTYGGSRITSVRASLKGFAVKVRTIRLRGHARFQVTVTPATDGAKHPSAYSGLRTVTVRARMANGKSKRLVEFFRQCYPGSGGNPNDPSASAPAPA